MFGVSLQAQVAYDDEAFESSVAVAMQDWEEQFAAAIQNLNAGAIKEATRIIKRLAVEGHPQSQHALGVFFQQGMGLRRNVKRAVQWLESASEQRYPVAMLAYAQLCVSGEGMRRDRSKARQLLAHLTERDWRFPIPLQDYSVERSVRSEACYLLGWLLVEGEGGAPDIEKGVRLLETAANTGSMQASVYLAIEYARGRFVERDMEASRRFFELVELQSMDTMRREFESLMIELLDPVVKEDLRKDAEEAGKLFSKYILDLQTQFALELLEEGEESYDPSLAVSLFRMAAEEGNSNAQAHLGRLLALGLGCEKDETEAARWLQSAAAEGNWLAQLDFGILCYMHPFLELDRSLADRYLKRVADGGVFSAQLLLDGDWEPKMMTFDQDLALLSAWPDQSDARAVYAQTKRSASGWGVKKIENPKKLYKQYLKAAQAGYHRAEYECGQHHYEGRDGEQDIERALPWLQKAARKDNANAIFRLGWIYDLGEGVEKSPERAVEYYERSVALGSTAAANNLANFLVEGDGVEKDVGRAFELYHLSADDGDPVANYNIGIRLMAGTSVETNVEEGMRRLTLSGEKGYKRALTWLIEHYDLKKLTGDPVELAYWMEKSAEFGDRSSMKEIAIFYRYGVGVPQSNLKAYHWIMTYLNQGFVNQTNMRQEIMDAELVSAVVDFLPWDYEAVLLSAELAAEDGWVGYDPEIAFELAKLFEKTHLFLGRFLLAELYLNDDLKKANPKKAVKLYRDIVKDCDKQGGPVKHKAKAAFRLSRLYATGDKVPQSDRQRAQWMKVAAEAGANSAQYYYSLYLLNGTGVDRDVGAAVEHLVPLFRASLVKPTVLLGEILLTREPGKMANYEPLKKEVLEQLVRFAEAGIEDAQHLLRGVGHPFAPPDREAPESKPASEDSEELSPWAPTVAS
ncbi:hypothetical protein QEH54_02455 [Pelagicoccus sp. SDUM812003]|nr:hypothetical protein [Pelagicoccus sp. SDUM812003]